jgi:hypothetical protein
MSRTVTCSSQFAGGTLILKACVTQGCLDGLLLMIVLVLGGQQLLASELYSFSFTQPQCLDSGSTPFLGTVAHDATRRPNDIVARGGQWEGGSSTSVKGCTEKESRPKACLSEGARDCKNL